MSTKLYTSISGAIILLVATALQSYSSITVAATQISQHGITWTFDRDYTTGKFANGDNWVVDPGNGVVIINIDPASYSAGTTVSGAMINPSPKDGNAQGFDERSGALGYTESLNVALDVSLGNPLTVRAGESLVSTTPRYGPTPDNSKLTPYIDAAAILTVLSNVPAKNSFRPAYVGSGANKTPQYTIADLDYSKLLRLEPTASVPSMSTVESYFEGPWIDFRPKHSSSELHPAAFMPWYGTQIATRVGIGALMVNCDFTNSEKETLVIRLVQLGIDLFGIVQDGGEHNWQADGGHASGRKWPILFAGVMLNDAGMMGIGDNAEVMFGEDDQTFYVEETSPGIFNYGYGGYNENDVGMPEWGIWHRLVPSGDDKSWYADYRMCCTASSWAGYALATELMGLEETWNWPPFFDYTERYMNITPEYRQWDRFTEEMWDKYHNSVSPNPPAVFMQ